MIISINAERAFEGKKKNHQNLYGEMLETVDLKYWRVQLDKKMILGA